MCPLGTVATGKSTGMCFHHKDRWQERNQLSESHMGRHHPTTWHSPWLLPPWHTMHQGRWERPVSSDTQQTSNLVFAELLTVLTLLGRLSAHALGPRHMAPTITPDVHRGRQGPPDPSENSLAALSRCNSFKFQYNPPHAAAFCTASLQGSSWQHFVPFKERIFLLFLLSLDQNTSVLIK